MKATKGYLRLCLLVVEEDIELDAVDQVNGQHNDERHLDIKHTCLVVRR